MAQEKKDSAYDNIATVEAVARIVGMYYVGTALKDFPRRNLFQARKEGRDFTPQSDSYADMLLLEVEILNTVAVEKMLNQHYLSNGSKEQDIFPKDKEYTKSPLVEVYISMYPNSSYSKLMKSFNLSTDAPMFDMMGKLVTLPFDLKKHKAKGELRHFSGKSVKGVSNLDILEKYEKVQGDKEFKIFHYQDLENSDKWEDLPLKVKDIIKTSTTFESTLKAQLQEAGVTFYEDMEADTSLKPELIAKYKKQHAAQAEEQKPEEKGTPNFDDFDDDVPFD